MFKPYLYYEKALKILSSSVGVPSQSISTAQTVKVFIIG
jgi:hypothetical protein